MAKKPPYLICSDCGSENLDRISSNTYICGRCGYTGKPESFRTASAAAEYRERKELLRMRERKLWQQTVFHRTVPAVVVVNWLTALFFAFFFFLGFLGYFKSEVFQWFFLLMSIAVVAIGFGAIATWGKERISF